MVQTKIAFVTTIPTDAIPAILAGKSINEKIPGAVEICLRTDGDFRDFGSLDDFIRSSKRAHIVLVHLMGELPEFDRLTSSLKAAGVPMMVASPLFDRNKEFMALSTVEPEDYQKILSYLNYGGKKNFENLFLYLANRFTGASYEVDSPVKPCWEGIYHPDFDYVPPIEEFVEKKVQPGRLTVAVWFHQTQW